MEELRAVAAFVALSACIGVPLAVFWVGVFSRLWTFVREELDVK